MNLPTYRIGLVQAQAYRKLQLSFRAALKPYNLTIPEWSLLGVVYDEGQMTLTVLTEILRSKASHPTVLVERLVTLGLLAREPSLNDRRSKVVSITAEGQRLVPMIEQAARAGIAKDLLSIPRSELETYFSILKRLAGI